jgi:hypothetical protein
MAIRTLIGFETGDFSEATSSTGATISSSTVKHGGYSGRVNASGAGVGSIEIRDNPSNNFSLATISFKFDLYVATAPGSGNEVVLIISDGGGVPATASEYYLRINSSRQLFVVDGAGSTRGTGSTALSLSTWYSISGYVVNSSTGAFELRINGTLELSGTGNFRDSDGISGAVVFARLYFGKQHDTSGQSLDVYFDSIVIGDDTTIPDSGMGIIARSPVTGGSPTVDAWTKSSGTDAGALWDETPFNATTNCVSPGSGDPLAQTADVASFASTQSPHGSDTIASGDTISFVQAIAIAKRSSGGGRTHELRYKFGSNAAVDTAIAPALGTSDAFVRGVMQSSVAYADLNAAEVGGEKSGGAAGQSMTIEDIWLMAAYVAAAAPKTAPGFMRFAHHPRLRYLGSRRSA